MDASNVQQQVKDTNLLLKIEEYEKRIVLDDRPARLQLLFIEYPETGEPQYEVIESYPIREEDHFDSYSEAYHYLRGYKKLIL